VVFTPTNPIPQELVEVLFSPLAYVTPTSTSPALPTLAPTQSVAFENGAPIEVQLVVTSNENGYLLQGDNWQVSLEARDTQGAPLVLDDSGNIVLNSERFVQFHGTGLAPGSIIKVWLFSDPSSIANVVADANGNFTGSAQLPSDIPDGEHTVQLNGLSKDGQVRSVALGVVVQPDLVAAPTFIPVDVAPLWNLLFITAGVVMMFLLVLLARKRWFLVAAKRRKRKEERAEQRSNRALAKKQKRDAAKEQLLLDDMDLFLAQRVAEANPSQQFPNDSRRRIGAAAPPNRKRFGFKPKGA
jgi:Na+-transporting methylmalonyl-CoA/oxaloacetate decarboxylase gamma subunit